MIKTKIVNIYPSMPIIKVNPPIRSMVIGVTKSIDEIRTCLISRAIVEEITNSGKVVRLDFSNYNKDNNDPAINNEDNNIKDVVINDNKEDLIEDEKINNNTDDNIEEVESDTNTIWKEAYEKALEGKDLSSMSRKQRRSIEASARSAADKAVKESINIVEETIDIESEN